MTLTTDTSAAPPPAPKKGLLFPASGYVHQVYIDLLNPATQSEGVVSQASPTRTVDLASPVGVVSQVKAKTEKREIRRGTTSFLKLYSRNRTVTFCPEVEQWN